VKKVSIVFALIASILSVPQAQAAEVGFVGKISSSEVLIDVTLSKFPTKGGLYIQQCLQAPEGVRPTICNKAAELWISTMRGASFVPTAKIVFKPTSTFTSGTTTVDCTISSCGAFLRYDHTVPADFSEDQFIPLTFKSLTQEQTLGTFKVPASIKSGKKLKFPATTNVGEPITYAVAGTCSLKQTTITVSKGTCTVLAKAAGKTDEYAAFMGSYSLKSK
jgi:hypothetical protein